MDGLYGNGDDGIIPSEKSSMDGNRCSAMVEEVVARSVYCVVVRMEDARSEEWLRSRS